MVASNLGLSRQNLKGFTLVELSIVIVIIGLIIAGITAGRSLVNSSRLRSQVSDLQKYNTAFNAFVFQYNAIPGDMKNARSYWGGTVTNGNGDGRLSYDANNATNLTHENLTLFQHLSMAGLIDGKYNNTWALGVGYPKLKIHPDKGMIAAGILNLADSSASYQLTDPEKIMSRVAVLELNVKGDGFAGSLYNDSVGVMTPIEARNIDVKMDDGVARGGIFQSYRALGSTEGNCLTGTDGDYLSTTTGYACDAEYILKN